MSQIEQLRQIIVGANADELAELKQRIEDIDSRTRDVAEVIAPAINQSDTTALVSSLQVPVSLSLKKAIRSEPQEYAEILYPVMAPSIRRAISQAISSLLITINRTLESATSVKGLKMRLQSMRTGVPYAELVLRQSVVYRVEHAYLIDRESGMPVSEVASQEAQSLDGDAVSAMFSAIQNFVQDSFSRDRSAMLTDLKVGDHNVWVAHGPKLMLACVIFGDAPEGLKDDLHDALYKIRTDYAIPIEDFDGDAADFAGVETILEPLLQLRLRDEGEEPVNDTTPKRSITPFLITGAVLLYLAYLLFSHNNKLSTVEYYLSRAPGIAATDIYWSDGKLVVEGLKDPDAIIPFGTFDAYGIEPDVFDFQMVPFRSLELGMELQRFGREFSLPEGVFLGERDGVLSLYGEAPILWLNSNEVRIGQLAADGRLSITGLSVSSASVFELLKTRLDANELESLLLESKRGKDNTILDVAGTIAQHKLTVVNRLFADSQWVTISVEGYQDDDTATHSDNN